jgi:hypothetical protein
VNVLTDGLWITAETLPVTLKPLAVKSAILVPEIETPRSLALTR